MKNPFRRQLGKPIALYEAESNHTQLRFIRTHIAALTSELGTIRHIVSNIEQRQTDGIERERRDRESLGWSLDGGFYQDPSETTS